ncbi:MAG TPA: hypothetical protein VLX92_22720 [Kofleriaceae bacterium]|nr:hypothetical protein [Kofleriaceae bacterium]
MAFLRDPHTPKVGGSTTQDEEHAPGKSTLVARDAAATAHDSSLGPPYSLAYIALHSYNHAATATNTANRHTKPIGQSLSGNLFTNPFYPLRGESFASAAKKVREQERFDQLWHQYNDVCRAPVVQAPMAEARTTGKLPPVVVHRLKTLLAQMQALNGFVKYLLSIGGNLAEPILRAEQLARAAQDAYETALRNSIRWAESVGDAEARGELDSDLDDAEAI